MSKVETNIYEIENLVALSCKYRLYRIKGLTSDSDDFDKNVRLLVDNLSRLRDAQSPCESLMLNGELFIAQPAAYPELPDSYTLIRTAVKIEKQPELKELNFASLDEISSKLAVRFLQFAIQQPLYNNPNLWQPQSGHPFFHKSPDPHFRDLSEHIDLYRGFSLRVISYEPKKIGICVDTSSKYVSRYYLPTNVNNRDEFRKKYKGHNCLYEYGSKWYEIKLSGLNDLNTSEIVLPNKKTLFDDIHACASNRKSQALISLPKDCSVAYYYNARIEQRNVPTGLCRLVFGTNHDAIRPFHAQTIKPPHVRRKEILTIVDRYLRDLTFGTTNILLSRNPIAFEEKYFSIPDLEFGNNKILSVRRSPGSLSVDVGNFGRMKNDLLFSPDAGLYIKKNFDRQYLVIPKSVNDTFGRLFVEDLKNEVAKLFRFSPEISYAPIILPYDDTIQRSCYQIASQILNALDQNDVKPGFAIVMIPKLPSYQAKREDELANMIMSKLRKRQLFASVIHTSVPSECFEDKSTDKTKSEWALVSEPKQVSKYKGYLKNVVLNKILLLNSFWPFILKTPLNADLIIGVDVKNHTAGFTLIYKNGSNLRFEYSDSNQKEQIGKNQIKSKLIEILSDEDPAYLSSISNIAIHRDGLLFSAEREGIKQAIDTLAKDGILPSNAKCTFVEIRKSSRVPFRMFKVVHPDGQHEEKVFNPNIGTRIIITDNDSFLCNTGYPYHHRGTSKPLHFIKIDGPLSIDRIAEDIFFLSNLTWTKVDDCSRYPLTIKMTDIRLREFAGEYDKDALEFGDE